MSSDVDDVAEVLNSSDVIAVAGVEIETVGVCSSGDEQVRETGTRIASCLASPGDYESVAAHGRGIELEWLQFRLDFLQPSLPFRRFGRSRGQNTGRVRAAKWSGSSVLPGQP